MVNGASWNRRAVSAALQPEAARSSRIASRSTGWKYGLRAGGIRASRWCQPHSGRSLREPRELAKRLISLHLPHCALRPASRRYYLAGTTYQNHVPGAPEHMQLSQGTARRIALSILIVQGGLVIGGWIFRLAVYRLLPVSPGDAYGVGDICELINYFALIAWSGILVVVDAVLLSVPRLRHWPTIAALALAALGALPLFLVVYRHLL